MEEEFAQGGFLSPEEHMQEYLELFLLLQQGEEAFAAFAQRCGRLEEREQKTDIFLPALYLRECLQHVKPDHKPLHGRYIFREPFKFYPCPETTDVRMAQCLHCFTHPHMPIRFDGIVFKSVI